MRLRYFLLLFASAIFSFSVHAAPSDELAIIRADIERATHRQAPACPSHLSEKAEYIFAFEGADGFCPSMFFQNAPDPDHAGLPVNQFLSERINFYTTQRFSNPSRNNKQKISEIVGILADETLKQSLWEESSEHNCALASTLLYNAETRQYLSPEARSESERTHAEPYPQEIPNFRGKKVLYYAWNQVNEAVNCAKKLSRIAIPESRSIRVSIVGYSLGGFAAVRFYEGIAGITRIDLGRILTLDPVRSNLRVMGSLFSNPDPIHVSGGLPYDTWRNFYQRSDEESLGWSKIRGALLIHEKGASIRNTLVTRSSLEECQSPLLAAFDKKMLPKIGHCALIGVSEIIDEVRLLLKN